MNVDRVLYRQLREQYGNEMVFAAPTVMMNQVPLGFTSSPDISLLKYDGIGRYWLQYDMEHNPTFQQYIPQVIFQSRKGKYYVVEELGDRSRRAGMRTLFFSGHIQPVDGHHDVIRKGLQRIVPEQVNYTPVTEPTFVGTVREFTTSNDQDSDHIGFTFLQTVCKVSLPDKKHYKGSWMTREELIEEYFTFDSWSKKYIDYLYKTGS